MKYIFSQNQIVSLPKNGEIKEGIITEIYAGGYIAQVSYGLGSRMAIWLSNMYSGMSGTKEFTIPAIGTKVLIYSSENSMAYILGCIPDKYFKHGPIFNIISKDLNYNDFKQHGIIDSFISSEFNNFSDDRPQDSFPGDVGWINEYNNVLGLLRGLVLLKANETSQVQTHSLDSLVRIVSQTFEHLSNNYEFFSFNLNGNLSNEFNGYCLQNEIYGTNVKESIKDSEGLLKDVLSYPRYICFTGYEGNNIQLFSRDSAILPIDKTLEYEIKPAIELQLDTKGQYTLRSNKSIKTQISNDIYFPYRLNNYKDNIVVEKKELEEFKYIEGDKTIQEDTKEEYENIFYSKQNYDNTNWKKFLYKNNKENTLSSVINQREDGSIVIKDKAGSYIELDGNGNIIITCAKDIIMRPGRNICELAGNHISVRCKNNIEICASEGSLKLKAEKDISSFGNNINFKTSCKNSELGIKFDTDGSISLNSNNLFIINNKTFIYSENDLLLQSENISLNTNNNNSKLNLNNETCSINTDNLNLINIENTNFKTNNFNVDSNYFNISSSSQGNIYGGPKGTKINHTHGTSNKGYGNDIFTYIPGPKGSKTLVKIESNTTYQYTGQNYNTIENLTKSNELQPFTENDINFIFNWTSFENYDNIITETYWQKNKSDVWDLKKDMINNTSSFPGYNYNKYKEYIITIDKTEVNSYFSGSFKDKSISDYKI